MPKTKDDQGRKDNTVREETNPFIEHTSGYESVGASQREERNAVGGTMIAIESALSAKRVRICDPDNLVGGVKYLVDSLRAADIIPEDDPQSDHPRGQPRKSQNLQGRRNVGRGN